ncbi:MAG: hypothetical protein NT069_10465 [Planctomycetota bacterium]|nr:hypothetical protein [Planctomycetota bacterium]
MSLADLEHAAFLLRDHLGADTGPATDCRGDSTGPEMTSVWTTVVELVLNRRSRSTQTSVPEDSALIDATACASLSTLELAALLEKSRLSTRLAAPLAALARWWVDNVSVIDPEDASDGDGRDQPPWEARRKQASRSLDTVRGVSRELGERIRLFALGEPVTPVSRAAQRVFCRHGWLDLQSEYDDWQSTLSRWAESYSLDRRQITQWLDELGSRWCGPKPKCDECPLKELLPRGGPYELDGE